MENAARARAAQKARGKRVLTAKARAAAIMAMSKARERLAEKRLAIKEGRVIDVAPINRRRKRPIQDPEVTKRNRIAAMACARRAQAQKRTADLVADMQQGESSRGETC